MAMSNNLPIKIGIIGLGIASGGYLENYSKDPRTKIVGVADACEELLEKVSNQYNPKYVIKDYKELLSKDDIDLIVVATPHFLHHQMVIDSLKAGKDVICEKPLAMNAKQAEQMAETSKKTGKRLFVGLNMRTCNAFRTVQRLIKEGKIGKPFMAKIAYLGHEIDRLSDPNNWKGIWEKAGGGILVDGGYHVIDIMNMLFGEPKEIKALCGKCVVKTENKCEDNALIVMKYSDDFLAEITASFTVKGPCSKKEPTLGLELDVYGSEGSVSAKMFSHNGSGWQVSLVCDDKEGQIELDEFKPDNLSLHFIDCLTEGIEPIASPEDAVKVHKIVDEVYQQNNVGKYANHK